MSTRNVAVLVGSLRKASTTRKVQQPEGYIGGAAALFDDAGTLINDSTREFLAKYMTAFAAWIERTRKS